MARAATLVRKSEGISPVVKISAGVALAAAAVAAGYFLYGKDGAKHRKKIRGWMLKLKGDIIDEMEKRPDMTEAVYLKLVDEAAKRYKPLKNVDPIELQELAQELKGHWGNISQQINSGSRGRREDVKLEITAKAKSPKKRRA